MFVPTTDNDYQIFKSMCVHATIKKQYTSRFPHPPKLNHVENKPLFSRCWDELWLALEVALLVKQTLSILIYDTFVCLFFFIC